jgi:hypothetical protein
MLFDAKAALPMRNIWQYMIRRLPFTKYAKHLLRDVSLNCMSDINHKGIIYEVHASS